MIATEIFILTAIGTKLLEPPVIGCASTLFPEFPEMAANSSRVTSIFLMPGIYRMRKNRVTLLTRDVCEHPPRASTKTHLAGLKAR